MKKLSQHDAVCLFAIHRGERSGLSPDYAKLMKRGLIMSAGPARFTLTSEGKRALEHWLGARL